jgi:hypothetical protein
MARTVTATTLTCTVRAILIALILAMPFRQLHSGLRHQVEMADDASFLFPKQGDVSGRARHGDVGNPFSNSRSFAGAGKDMPGVGNPPSDTTAGRFAYAVLVAGCDPATSNYRAFIYNVLVSAHILRTSGSTADFIVMVRIKRDSNHTKLPDDEEILLQRAGVVVHYLPRVKNDNFYSAMLAKFAILELTQYDRILFMDADVIALCNLDYLFDASMSGILRENIVLAWQSEPASGGFFMLQPGQKHQLDAIIKRQYDRRITERVLFNESWGWGSPIEPPDYWIDVRAKRHTQWKFTAAYADQGLLYHWVKYHRKSVSIFFHGRIEEWVNGTVHVRKNQFPGCMANSGPNSLLTFLGRRDRRFRSAPSRDFIHFTGNAKPWLAHTVPPDVTHLEGVNQSISIWFHYFRRMQAHLNLTVSVEDVIQLGHAPLGSSPTKAQASSHEWRIWADASMALPNANISLAGNSQHFDQEPPLVVET